MLDKPLDQAELDLMEIIRHLHAENGPFLRSTLSVVGRGRGLDVARPFNRLKSLGLVEEIEKRPFFLFRLFGAKTTVLLRPCTQADALVSSEPPPPLGAAAVAELPRPPEPEVVPQAAAPMPEAAPVPKPEAVPAAPAKPVQTRPIRMAPDAYTDEIGGQPMAYAPVPLAAGLDPDLLDGLREMLEVMGMEMTPAGAAMISDRMAKGASAGEALCQVALYAFAHAAHHDTLAVAQSGSNLLHDYAIEVIRELEKLRDAGEVRAEAFERDMRAIWALVDNTTDRRPLVAELLSDPMGGAAPPAVLPEDVRGVEDIED
jgi:hypothetical protein